MTKKTKERSSKGKGQQLKFEETQKLSDSEKFSQISKKIQEKITTIRTSVEQPDLMVKRPTKELKIDP